MNPLTIGFALGLILADLMLGPVARKPRQIHGLVSKAVH